MKSTEFRKELAKIMPGYKWTVRRNRVAVEGYLSATGIQTAGFNRVSTLQVTRIERDDSIKYEVKSSGFGCKAPWLSLHIDGTLARALRGLQDKYETMAQNYAAHASALKYARKFEKD